jgi:hypothetical protein
MGFQEFESGAGRKPMKTMARGGHRTWRIKGTSTGGTLGASRQKEYLVRTPLLAGVVRGSVIEMYTKHLCCMLLVPRAFPPLQKLHSVFRNTDE